MAAVILAHNGRPAGPSNPIDVKIPLVVVREDKGSPRYVCRVCAQRGERSVFYSGEERAYELHVTRCANRHEADLRGQSLRTKNPQMFDPDHSIDPEYGRWLRQNREAIADGRKKW